MEFEDQNVSGDVDRDAMEIGVSTRDPYQRQAFTIAHELGHFALQHGKDGEIVLRVDTTKRLPPEEQEANWYAACLLMPADDVRNYWPLTKNDERAMARIFGVSLNARHHLIVNLGLIDSNDSPY